MKDLKAAEFHLSEKREGMLFPHSMQCHTHSLRASYVPGTAPSPDQVTGIGCSKPKTQIISKIKHSLLCFKMNFSLKSLQDNIN